MFVSPPTKSTKTVNFIAYLKKSRKCYTRWWLLPLVFNGISIWYRGSHPISSPYHINLRSFCISSLSNACLSNSCLSISLSKPLNKVLMSYNPPCLLVFNVSIPLSLFVHHLYLSISITPAIYSNIPRCYCHQTS